MLTSLRATVMTSSPEGEPAFADFSGKQGDPGTAIVEAANVLPVSPDPINRGDLYFPISSLVARSRLGGAIEEFKKGNDNSEELELDFDFAGEELKTSTHSTKGDRFPLEVRHGTCLTFERDEGDPNML